jgi:uncharacterized membrane protein (DUF106 family)
VRSVQLLIADALAGLVTLLGALSPVWIVTAIALLLTVPILLVVRALTDRRKVRKTKNAIKGHLLELWLFRDDTRTVIGAQGRILRLNARYVFLTLKPFLVLLIPMALILIPLEGWFGFRALRPGDSATVVVSAGGLANPDQATIGVSDGLRVETPALRIPATREIAWRIRALQPGVHRVWISVDGRRLEKEVTVTRGLASVSPTRVSAASWETVLFPAEPPLPPGTGIERIDVGYPAASLSVFGVHMHWLIYFVLATVVFMFALRGPLRVEI